MKSVLVRLQEYSPRASEVEKGVIKVLLEKPETAAECSIQKLAAISFTSASTIIRLCRKLGFGGYKEFHKALLYELAVRKETQDERKRDLEREDGLEAIIEKVTYKNIISLENTKKLIDLDVFQKCVDLLSASGNICLFGMGASLLVARDAYLKFLRVNKPCQLCDDWHAQYIYARNITSDDVAIIISYSGMTAEMVRCAEAVKKNGAPIIAITRFEDSALVKLSDYNLYVATMELFFRKGAMSSRISQLNTVDILFAAYVNQNYEECMELIGKTHIKKVEKPSGGYLEGEMM